MTNQHEQDARHLTAVGIYYQTNDEQALGPMLRELREVALGYLRGRLRVLDTERATDIVQEGIARFLRQVQARRFKPSGSGPGALLCVICKHLYFASLRATPSAPSREEDPFRTLSNALTFEGVAPGEQTDAESQAAATVAAATQAVLGLDPAARAAVLLHYYQGLPTEQAAQQLGLSLESYSARLHRGMDALRTWGQHQPRPSAEVYAALPYVNTGDLFREPVRLAG